MITEIQIKTTMRYHFTSVKWLKLTTHETTDVGKDMKKGGPSYIAGRNANWCSQSVKQYGGSSKS